MPRKRVLLLSNGSIFMAAVLRLLQGMEAIELEGVASDDPEALGAVRRFAPHVIVLDVGGGAPGRELATRALSELPDARVIALDLARTDMDVYRAQRVPRASVSSLLAAIQGRQRGGNPMDSTARASWNRDELERLFKEYFGHKLSPGHIDLLVSEVLAGLADRHGIAAGDSVQPERASGAASGGA